ncbi:DUF2809 domain-containing protein, partial [Pseudomonas aeruginosa]|nr:DUF2809 domain-containing protein [Pseudomonas aeruginosa]
MPETGACRTTPGSPIDQEGPMPALPASPVRSR